MTMSWMINHCDVRTDWIPRVSSEILPKIPSGGISTPMCSAMPQTSATNLWPQPYNSVRVYTCIQIIIY